MTILRKILLFTFALAVGIGAYMAYRFFTNPPAIPVGGGYTIVKSESPSKQLDDAKGAIGETVIGQTEISEFNLLDAQGNIKSRFGFDRLVHSEGFEWELVNPYVNIFDDKYTCNVKSATGFIRIEMVGAKPVPVSARLSDKVSIDFKTTEGDRDCQITLDSLNYDIERNSFESAGEVIFTAENIKMAGKGMSLVYNPLDNRIELLKIPALDYITISEQKLKTSSQSEDKPLQEPKSQPTATAAENGVFYEFILNDNVNITTEKDKISATSVRISNILWGDSAKSQSIQSGQPQEQSQDVAQQESLPQKSPDGFEYWQPQPKPAKQPETQVAEYETTEIHITCDGGLTFRPHTTTGELIERAIDLIGSPVTIDSERFVAESPYLWYGLDSKTLRLDSRNQGEVSLVSADGKATLKASGSIFWNEEKSIATVKGPGAIYAAGENDTRQTRLNFTDTITAYMPGRILQKVEVFGGFDADISGSNPAKVSSRNALVGFSDSGNLNRLQLSDNVVVSSSQGGVKADLVIVDFLAFEDGSQEPVKAIATGNAELVGFSDKSYLPVLSAAKIEYEFKEQIATASGSIELKFNIPSTEGKKDLPLIIRADENVVYRANAGYIEFNKNVRGISTSEFANYNEQSRFQCDKLLVYLAENPQDQTATLSQLLLEGEKVVLENKRYTDKGLISIINLECKEFAYDAVSGIMTAKGEGNIKVNNRNVIGTTDNNEISFGGPCYALIENFSSLVFDTKQNIIDAAGSGKMLHIGYVPIMPDGNVGTRRLIDAGKIRINLSTTPEGKTNVSHITATNKVSYYEPDKYQLIGDKLLFDASTSIVRIDGTKSNPCVLNSTLVDFIEYNIKTGTIKSSLGSVSSIPAGN